MIAGRLATCLALALLACDAEVTPPATTEGRATSELALSVRGRASESWVVIDAVVLGGGNALALAPGDRLTATTSQGGAPIELIRVGSSYATELQRQGDVLGLALTRASGAGAPSSELALPAPFTVSAPSGPASRAAGIELTWAPVAQDASMTITVVGDCVSMFSRTLAQDVGRWTLQGSDLFARADAGSASCPLHVTLVRAGGHATFDPALAPLSRATLTQERAVTIETTP